MEGYLWIPILISIWILWAIVAWIRETISNAKKYRELKPILDHLSQQKEEFEKKKKEEYQKIEAEHRRNEKDHECRKKELKKIAKQKSMGFPWLAEAYADYFSLRDGELAEYLRFKKHPAYTAAEIVRDVQREKRNLRKENKIISYKINYFEKLFPWLEELIATDEDEDIPVRIDENAETDGDNEDRVKDLLTPEEYKSLPSVERNQIALDRYLKNRNKSRWAIGRDYEMYVGYLYEQKGYSIEYKGIVDGFEDLGRDVIAQKGGEVCIIQCKNWAQYKEIHEIHIFQLFGTTMEYWI